MKDKLEGLMKKRARRARSLDNYIECLDDEWEIRQKVGDMNWFERKYFKSRLDTQSEPVVDQYLHLIPEYVVEVYNCAYEDTLEFLKMKGIKKYLHGLSTLVLKR